MSTSKLEISLGESLLEMYEVHQAQQAAAKKTNGKVDPEQVVIEEIDPKIKEMLASRFQEERERMMNGAVGETLAHVRKLPSRLYPQGGVDPQTDCVIKINTDNGRPEAHRNYSIRPFEQTPGSLGGTIGYEFFGVTLRVEERTSSIEVRIGGDILTREQFQEMPGEELRSRVWKAYVDGLKGATSSGKK